VRQGTPRNVVSSWIPPESVITTAAWRCNDSEFGKFTLATAIGIVIGALYVLPLAFYFGSPWANVHGYSAYGNLFGIPFYAIIKGTYMYPSPWTNLILTFGWIFFVLAGIVAMGATESYRAYARVSRRSNLRRRLSLCRVLLQLSLLGTW
jgi:hypothetical protein